MPVPPKIFKKFFNSDEVPYNSEDKIYVESLHYHDDLYTIRDQIDSYIKYLENKLPEGISKDDYILNLIQSRYYYDDRSYHLEILIKESDEEYNKRIEKEKKVKKEQKRTKINSFKSTIKNLNKQEKQELKKFLEEEL